MRKPPNAGKGRVKGVPNKATADARAAIALFVNTNASRLQGWLDSIASDPKKGPEVAYRCVLDLLEYHVPKLARTELTGKDGAPFSSWCRGLWSSSMTGRRRIKMTPDDGESCIKR